MTIWLLAVVLLASLAGLGYRQGAIRVAFSFVGILVGALLAVPLGHVLNRLILPHLGLHDPLLIWMLGPLIIFVLVSIGFKVGAAAVHNKVDVYYKYRAGDLRLALWERLNHRLGLCVGLLNGAAYLILLGFVIYAGSYATFQLASSDQDPKWMRLLNQMGRDLHSTGFAKVARSLDSIPQVDYDMADLAGVLYHNPLIEARLSRYPGFLILGDRPEFQELANDSEFTNLRQTQPPVMALYDHPRIVAIRSNPELLQTIWNTVVPDLADLKVFFAKGQSPKYGGEKILGHWQFNINATMGALRRAKPTMPASEMQKVKKWMATAFNKTTLVARTDNQFTLKNLPALHPPANGATPAGPQNLQGQWKSLDGGRYVLTVSGADIPANIEHDRLGFKLESMDLVFDPED